MLATLFAFTFSFSFSLIYNSVSYMIGELQKKNIPLKKQIFVFFGSLITAALVSLGGNLHVLYIFFTPYKNENPVPFSQLSLALQSIPNAYWYPNATRFIYNTIHEFPIYSFVVSDLHGHVLDIPIVLTILALLLALFFSKKITLSKIALISFFLASAYMTNAWDGAIYLLLTIAVISYIHFVHISPQQKYTSLKQIWRNMRKTLFGINVVYDVLLIIVGFFLLSLPFSLFFQTNAIVHGIGVLCAPKFLTNLQHIGPFLFETDHCQKSPVWQLAILYGFFYFFVMSFIIFLIRVKKILQIDIFILLLIGLATILITIPEFFYMKDIYPAHYRANTMFKLTYEAFIMLSLVSGYVIIRISLYIGNLKTILGRSGTLFFLFITIVLLSLVLYYPSFAINSYYNNLSTKKPLNGIEYLKTLHPQDYAAIQWINKHIPNQPVIAEAQGDSYTDYARISTNTGLPTILGWTVHEWLWRGRYEIPSPRIAEIQTLYETKDINVAKSILQRYAVSYVYIGDLEKQKYPKLSKKKFSQLGNIVYKNGETVIYSVQKVLE
jgi:YYY domain-containing protein